VYFACFVVSEKNLWFQNIKMEIPTPALTPLPAYPVDIQAERMLFEKLPEVILS
jgi:hypothetical protein